MKKFLALILALTCLVLCAGGVFAADALDVAFQSALGLLDMYYELNAEFMKLTVDSVLYTWELAVEHGYQPIAVSAEEYEEVLFSRFAVSDAVLAQIRAAAGYDAAAGTYQISYAGGFGGNLPNRLYDGYVANRDGSYTVYYRHVTYEYLPANAEIWEEIEKNNYPPEVKYNDLTYTYGPTGYYRIASYDAFGNQYKVEYENGTVRILSKSAYTAESRPTETVTFLLEEGIAILREDVFPAGTVVTAQSASDPEILESAEAAMAEVAEKYAVYEFSAVLDGEEVQPEGTVTVTIALPEEFSEEIRAWYLAPDGSLEELNATISQGLVTVELGPFGTCILSERVSQPDTENPGEGPEVTDPSATEPSQGTEEEQTPTATVPTEASGQGQDPASNEGLYLGLAVAGVLLLVALVLILRKKVK